jgi:hypothetical protein
MKASAKQHVVHVLCGARLKTQAPGERTCNMRALPELGCLQRARPTRARLPAMRQSFRLPETNCASGFEQPCARVDSQGAITHRSPHAWLPATHTPTDRAHGRERAHHGGEVRVPNIFLFLYVCTCTDLQASVPTRWRARVTRACRPRRPFDCSDVRGGLRREKHHTAASIGPAPFASAPAAAAAAAGEPADCPFWGVRAASPGAHCRVFCRTSARKTALCATAYSVVATVGDEAGAVAGAGAEDEAALR